MLFSYDRTIRSSIDALYEIHDDLEGTFMEGDFENIAPLHDHNYTVVSGGRKLWCCKDQSNKNVP